MKPILSLRDLSFRLGVPLEDLRVVAREIKTHYRVWPLFDKKNLNIVRQITSPSPKLKDLQRRVNARILSKLSLPDSTHGGVPTRSTRSNAAPHLGQPCVINLDVRKFYPNIRHYVVYRMLKNELGFGRDVASLLTRLMTLGSEIPQGAPTSTAIANILLAERVDKPLSALAKGMGCQYTRFVDDITLSGPNPRPLINTTARRLSARRLPMYRRTTSGKPKQKITPNSRAQAVTGLLVNSGKAPSVSRERRDDIRAAIYAVRKTPSRELTSTLASLRGQIAYVRAFNPGSARRLEKYLDAMLARRAVAPAPIL
jgi:hypothetical protein